ncbi:MULTISPECIES: glycosyltransferase family 8 protein [unclassified Campylobacter]|uniref:glycosyltransferase family 8 protein n=1 Tax=unclassified Campylobacter TaxID=2593542 RepID=UPI001E0040ED|nr:glycosyltransferase family 8 protein [Campylobacter sp. RM12651]MBZ7984107.1 glycosyltransferase family 8 protein [Campylobacter sp. RM12647]ULO02570.1 glycosyltransferase, family 8 [Campylobacter sp. RM12651]
MKPLFQHKIGICFAINETFLNQMIVSLQSIIDNLNHDNQYDILILNDSRNEIKKRTIKAFYEKENISIRFISLDNNLKEKLKDCNEYCGDSSLSTYYRLFISDIFTNFQHIIYLDADTVVLDDISKLYKKCDDNYLFAACVDNKYSCYMKRVSKITPFQINSWFNAGVMIFNIDKCRNMNLSKLALDVNEKYKECKTINDEIMLNLIALENKTLIKQLDLKWNCLNIDYFQNPDKDYISKIGDKPSLIHYVGTKPFQNVKTGGLIQNHSQIYGGGQIWWTYARRSLAYEEFLDTFIEYKTSIKLPKIFVRFITLFIYSKQNRKAFRSKYTLM